MGYAKIIWVYEDGIRSAESSSAEWERLKPKVGEATLQVCLGSRKGVKSAAVLGHGNCVNYCDEAHSTDNRLYLWGRNCLRPLHKLNEEELATVEQIIAEERERRRE